MSKIDDLRSELLQLEAEEKLKSELDAAREKVRLDPESAKAQSAMKAAAGALRQHRIDTRYDKSAEKANADLAEAEEAYAKDPGDLDLAVAVHSARAFVARLGRSVSATVSPTPAGAGAKAAKVGKAGA